MSNSHGKTTTWRDRVHPPLFSRPPLPSRLVLATSVLWLSHTGVISSPTAGAYGNVTGRWWTWWLLTHYSPPMGRTLCRTSPQRKDWRRSNTEQVAQTDARVHMGTYRCRRIHVEGLQDLIRTVEFTMWGYCWRQNLVMAVFTLLRDYYNIQQYVEYHISTSYKLFEHFDSLTGTEARIIHWLNPL